MKPIILITALTLSLIFSSTCYAEWTEVSKNAKGDTFYVDFDTIKQQGRKDEVYYWQMSDFIKPVSVYLSKKSYVQGDYYLFRNKWLSFIAYRESMGRELLDI